MQKGDKYVNFYKCDECDNILLEMSRPDKLCAKEGMELLKPNTSDGAGEKHVPVVSYANNAVTVKVGAAEHPMLPEHYIEWIYIQTTFGGIYCKLNPGDPPEATFNISPDEIEGVFEFCNIHGLWKTPDSMVPDPYTTNNVACSPEFPAGCVDPTDEN